MPDRASWIARRLLALYWVLLVLATHWPKALLPEQGRFAPSDKRLHFWAYAILAGLLVVVLHQVTRRRRLSTAHWVWLCLASIAAVAIAAGYGLIDEATQPWTGRDFDWADWRADTFGAVVGTAAVAGCLWFFRARSGRAALPIEQVHQAEPAGNVRAGD